MNDCSPGLFCDLRGNNGMWFDDIAPDASWTVLWSGYFICGQCGGIRRFESNCAGCDAQPPVLEEHVLVLNDGEEIRVPMAFLGAEGRFEDYIYLDMLEREWKRPVSETAPRRSTL